MLKTARAVQAHLKQIMETGQLATLQLDQKRSMLERARQWTGFD
jgi:DNA-binding phage protein